ncbi:MAG: serine/threonine-protein kinase PknK [Myxococcota bacterium]
MTIPSVAKQRYRIRRKLGEGGMGAVYLAHDADRGADVAIKILSRMSPAGLYRFKNEFRALADLRHPNLVSLYELVAGADQWFFSMELIEGVPFTSFVRRRSEDVAPPPAEQATLVLPHRSGGSERASGPAPVPGYAVDERRLRASAVQLAEAVAFLHDQGRLHRDLKPMNVLVTPSGRVVVLDFGLVRDQSGPGDEATPELAVVGTPGYMAPEQAMCLPLTPAADWYAVGTMLFQALTGRLPFEGNVEEILAKKRQGPAPPPSQLVPGVPPDLDALCVDLLQSDPGQRPDGMDVLHRLTPPTRTSARRTSSMPPAPASAVPFVGRAAEVAALEAAWKDVTPNHPVVVRVSGRSGMGTSTVVHRFLRSVAQMDDAVVLRGRCYEREAVPYKAFDNLVDALSRYLRRLPEAEATALMPRDAQVLARVFPVLLRVDAMASSPRRDLEIRDDHELRRRAFAALKELLARIADRWRLVLHIDDLHWADVDSVELLGEVLASPDAPAALVLLSHRSDEAGASEALRALGQLERQGEGVARVRHVCVEPLAFEESIELVSSLLTRPDQVPRALLEEVAAEAAGSPFLLEAFAHHLNAGRVDGPIYLDDVLRARTDALPAGARRLLEVVAVSGRPLSQTVARRAAGLGSDANESVGVLRAANLVWTQGVRGQDLIETYHERIRDHVVAALGPEALRLWHRRLATALRQETVADHEAIAQHFEAAGDRGQAAFHGVEAGRRAAASLAFDRAARLYRFALDRLPEADSRRLELEEGLADALRNAGQGVEAAHAYERAARLSSGDRALEHLRCAAEQLLRSGHVDDALRVAQPLLKAVGLRWPSNRARALGSALGLNARLALRGLAYEPREESDVEPDLLRRIDTCWSVGHGLVGVNAIEAGAMVTRAALLALRAGESRRVATTLSFQAIMMALAGLPGHESVIDAADAAAQRSDDRYARALVTGARGFLGHVVYGDLETNLRLMTEAEKIFRTLDEAANFEIATAHFQMLASLFYLGRWDEIVARFPGYVREAERRGNLYGAATLVLLYGDVPALVRDDPEAGDRLVDAYLARWRKRDVDLQLSLGLVCQIRLAVYQGRVADMVDEVEERVRAAERAGITRGRWMRLILLEGRARALLAAARDGSPSQRNELVRRATRDVRRIRRIPHRMGPAMAEMHAACIELARGRTEAAAQGLRRAEHCYAQVGMRLHALSCARVRGRLEGTRDGLDRIVDADEAMRAQGIVAPERVARTLVPG